MTLWDNSEEVVRGDRRDSRYILRYEDSRRPLMTGWQYAILCWILAAGLAFIAMLSRSGQ